jgi:hypothetical protein
MDFMILSDPFNAANGNRRATIPFSPSAHVARHPATQSGEALGGLGSSQILSPRPVTGGAMALRSLAKSDIDRNGGHLPEPRVMTATVIGPEPF